MGEGRSLRLRLCEPYCRFPIAYGLVAREVVGGRGGIGAEDGGREILLAGFVPGNHAEPGGIVEDAAVTEGHACEDAHVAIHAGEAAIDVAEFALLLFEYGNVGI